MISCKRMGWKEQIGSSGDLELGENSGGTASCSALRGVSFERRRFFFFFNWTFVLYLLWYYPSGLNNRFFKNPTLDTHKEFYISVITPKCFYFKFNLPSFLGSNLLPKMFTATYHFLLSQNHLRQVSVCMYRTFLSVSE